MRSVLSIVAVLCVFAVESAPSPQKRLTSGDWSPLIPLQDVKGLLSQLQDYRKKLVENRQRISDTTTEPLGRLGRPNHNHRKHGRPGTKDSEAEDKRQNVSNKQPTEDNNDQKQGTRNQGPNKPQEDPKNNDKVLDQRSKVPEDEPEGQKPTDPLKSLPSKPNETPQKPIEGPIFPLQKPTDQEPVKGLPTPPKAEEEPLKGLPLLPGGNPGGQPPKTIPLPPSGSQPTTEDWSNVPKPQPKEVNGGIDDLKRKIIGAPCLGGVDHSGSCRSSSYE